MYCGFLRTECNSISIGELIKILEPYKNTNTNIKIQNSDHFYIHFDQDGDFININNLSLDRSYRNSTRCKNCEVFNKDIEKCCCDGKHCVTVDLFKGPNNNEQSSEQKSVEVKDTKEDINVKSDSDDEFDKIVKTEDLIIEMGSKASDINAILGSIKSLMPNNDKKFTIISTEDVDVILLNKNK